VEPPGTISINQTSLTSDPTVRKTLQYSLQPTREQEQVLVTVLWRCHTLYNCALEQRTAKICGMPSWTTRPATATCCKMS